MDFNPKIQERLDLLRDKILNNALLLFSLLGAVAQFVASFRLFEYGLDWVFILQNSVFLLLVAITIFRKKLHRLFKLAVIVILGALVLFSGLSKIGMLASAKVYIVLIPLFVSFISNFRNALYAFFILLLIYVFWGSAYSMGWAIVEIDLAEYGVNPNSWMLDGLVYSLAALGMLFVSYFYHRVVVENAQLIERQSVSLNDQRAKFRLLFEASSDAVLLLSEGRFVDCNSKAVELFNADRDYLLGKTPVDVSPEQQLDGEDSAEKTALLLQLVETGEPQFFEWRHLRPDGEVFDVSISLNKVNLERAVLIQAVLRDISSQKKYEFELVRNKEQLEKMVKVRTEALELANEELTATNEELYQQRTELETALAQLHDAQAKLVEAEKMRSLGMLTAGVAHEINNPLNFLHGAVCSLKSIRESPEDFTEDEKEEITDKMFYSMDEGIRRIAEIVKSLNQFSRSKDDVWANCDIHEIIDNCLLILNNKLKHTCEIVKKYDDNIMLFGNEGKLHQVFLNLLSNAAYAVDVDGRIEIETQKSEMGVVVKIWDNGPGVDAKEIDHIFEPFYTTKPAGQGTGLGLSITQSIIQEHNGAVSVDSDGRSYTVFVVNLPFRRQA